MYAVVCEDRRMSAVDAGVLMAPRLKLGTVVGRHERILPLRAAGVVMLPFDETLPPRACAGYTQQHFGDGWEFKANQGERGAPSMLAVQPGCRVVHWAARFSRIDPGAPWSGQFRLTHNTANQRGLGQGMSQVQHVAALPPEEFSFVGYGKSLLNMQSEGLLFVELYATANNVQVEWLALTQYPEDIKWSDNG